MLDRLDASGQQVEWPDQLRRPRCPSRMNSLSFASIFRSSSAVPFVNLTANGNTYTRALLVGSAPCYIPPTLTDKKIFTDVSTKGRMRNRSRRKMKSEKPEHVQRVDVYLFRSIGGLKWTRGAPRLTTRFCPQHRRERSSAFPKRHGGQHLS